MSGARPAVLILGGYGTFGTRLARLLAEDARLELIVAGRSRDKAAALCASLPHGAARRALAFERDGDVAAQLAAAAPDLVVDASGPFQAYGADPYRVARAALAQGAHYLDLADGADFVRGIGALDAAAKAQGRFALAGASTFPTLSVAVLRDLTAGMSKVRRIEAGIAPSPRAGLGLSLIRAIASYAGKPVPIVRGGRSTTGTALAEARRRTVAPPGALPLTSRRFSLIDVPDLRLVPALWPGLEELWIGAGTVPACWHRALTLLAWLARRRLVPPLARLGGLFHAVNSRLVWGEHRGGMYVAAEGQDAGGMAVLRSWHLVAEGDDGPDVPAMAAAALVARWLDGAPPAPGARPAHDEVTLADYQRFFARRAIATGRREESAASARLPVHERLLGEAWARVPAPIRALHEVRQPLRAAGIGDVERGSGLLARLAGAVMGFPPAASGVPVEVDFVPERGGELWRRRFAGRGFASRQEAGRGRSARLLVERFGPLAIAMAPVVEGERLRLVLRRWSVCGVPLPRRLAPRLDAYEHAGDGRFNFHVAIGHPLAGAIVRYRGWLVPQGTPP